MSFVILIRLNEEVDATSGHQFNSQPQVYVALRFSSLSPSPNFLFFYYIYTVARKVGAPPRVGPRLCFIYTWLYTIADRMDRIVINDGTFFVYFKRFRKS